MLNIFDKALNEYSHITKFVWGSCVLGIVEFSMLVTGVGLKGNVTSDTLKKMSDTALTNNK